jgi:transglutaminase-like putative cysteine protease
MHDVSDASASVERLAKLISRSTTDDDQSPRDAGQRHRPVFEISLTISEGWFSLFLLAVVVYSTIWCIQAVGWVDHLNILTLTTGLGLLVGVITAKQLRLPQLTIHCAVSLFALLLAYWQTANAFYQGDLAAFMRGIEYWVQTVMKGGNGNNDAIFLFLITALSFLLAYASAWLLYRARNPWLLIIANAIVLLINLSNVDAGYVLFLAVFLIAALLLLLRFNLHESLRVWRRRGLRFADDIGWDIMQAGTIISIGILIFSWLLPWGYTNPLAAQIWTLNSNPWVQLENTWNRVISLGGGKNPSNHGNFENTLVLGGNPNLNHDLVMKVQSTDTTQYLMSLSYDTYLGSNGWTNESVNSLSLAANQALPGPEDAHEVKQTITLVDPPGEQKAYLLGFSQIEEVNLPSVVQSGTASGDVIGWVDKQGNLAPNMTYTVVSLVSSADVATLESVPMPNAAPTFPSDYPGPLPPTVYDTDIVNANLQLPSGLDPRIAALARQVTRSAPTMYDKAVALETYLRTNFTYSVDIQPPPGVDPVSWFLFNGSNKGFCNYFASAMAIMARTLGIPARVVVGYTNGTYDSKSHDQLIYGNDAHAWTQVYFAGYGWINFEPSASFPTFSRPLPNQFGSTSNSINSLGGGSAPVGTGARGRTVPELNGHESGTNANGAQSGVAFQQGVSISLGGLLLLLLFGGILFGIWWNRLFRRYDLAMQLYGRLCVLANWAGVELRLSQTPYEYLHDLSVATPQYADSLERFGNIYVRERWADPQSPEHPERTGEVNELRTLWQKLQPALFLYVLRHPRFLRRIPAKLSRFLTSMHVQRKKHIDVEDDVLDDDNLL